MPNLNLNHDTLLLVFVGVTAVAFLLQVLLLLGVLLAVLKGLKSIKQEMEALRSSLTPLIGSTQRLMNQVSPAIESAVEHTRQTLMRMSPKVESAVSDLADIAARLRTETEKIQETTLEIVEKVRAQSGRIDELITGLLDRLNRVGQQVTDAVSKPIRQAQGFAASIKAAIESLNSAVPPRPSNTPNDRP